MQNTKLFQLLQSFTPQEIQRFQAYLQSPFFNTDETIFKVFESIRSYLHSRNKEIPEAKKIWSIAIPNQKFNNLIFNKHCSYLYQYASEFIAFHSLKNNSNLLQLEYLKVLNQRQLNDLFPFHANRFLPILKKSKRQNENFLLENFFFQQQQHQHLEQLQSRKQSLNTNQVLQNLDEFYLHEKLKYWNAALHYKRQFDQAIHVNWKDFFSEWLSKNKLSNNNEAYRQLLLMQTSSQSEIYYNNLKKILFEQTQLLDQTTQKEIYSFLVVYCIEKINQGNAIFYKEIFMLYKYALQHQLLIKQKKMSPWDFKNIVAVALQQTKIKWAEKFILEYKKFLPKEEADNAFNYNMARVYFNQRKFTESLKLLQMVAYTDLFYQLDVKIIQTKTLYELEETETLNDLIISFKKLINNKHRLSKHYQTVYRKYLMYLQKILLLKNKTEATTLLEQLKNDIQVPDKIWLTEKIELRIKRLK